MLLSRNSSILVQQTPSTRPSCSFLAFLQAERRGEGLLPFYVLRGKLLHKMRLKASYRGLFFISIAVLSTHNSAVAYVFDSRSQLLTAVGTWTSNEASARSTYGDISSWDTSRITSMEELFFSQTNFNADLSSWDVGRVENML